MLHIGQPVVMTRYLRVNSSRREDGVIERGTDFALLPSTWSARRRAGMSSRGITAPQHADQGQEAVSAIAFLSYRLYGRKKFSQQSMPDR
jgi:hypothetical protein